MLIALDTETELITPGNLQPALVCLSYYNGLESGVIHRDDTLSFVKSLFLDSGNSFVLHNGAYDFAVLMKEFPELIPLVFQLYEDRRVHDTMIREALFLIRKGTFNARVKGSLSLDGLSKKYLRKKLDKEEDGWRLRYGELKHLPISEWPKRAVDYAREDAESTLKVFREQEDSPDEWLQCSAALSLHLMSCRGVITDPIAVEALKSQLLAEVEERKVSLLERGILRITGKKKPKLQKDTKLIRRLVVESLGNTAPKTEASKRFPDGQVQIGSESLYMTDNEDLHMLVRYAEAEKLLTTYVPALEKGTEHSINARFNVLVETGRTSCSNPNLQNLPRKEGARECFIPRAGYVYAACDYTGAEMVALAQLCYTYFGKSKMREALIEGRDLHLDFASQLLSIPYDIIVQRAKEPEIKEARQFAKIGNFGLPGGLGYGALVKYANGMGYKTTMEEAKNLKLSWLEQWPEMNDYFRRAGFIADEFGSRRVVHYNSGRVRGDVRFTQACNTPFQGLIADVIKDALFRVSKECYVVRDSPLYGSFPVLFIHDEIIIEAPVDKASAAAERLSFLMNEAGKEWMPDVPIDSTVHLMDRWYKKAEAVRDEKGKLIPWKM